MKSLSRVRLLATPWTVAYQAPLFMGFSKQEYWSGLPFPSPYILSTEFKRVVCYVTISSRLKDKNFYVTKTKECRGKKKVCPFLLLENSRLLSPWGPPRLLINLPRN